MFLKCNLICIKASVLLCCVSARTDKYSKKTNKQKKQQLGSSYGQYCL